MKIGPLYLNSRSAKNIPAFTSIAEFRLPYYGINLLAGLEIDNEKVKNNLIFDTSKKSSEFLHSITKIKSRLENIDQSITSNRYFSLTQLTASTASTYFDANGGRGFRLGKVENAGIEGIAYYDGQFKTGIPEGLLTFLFSL